MAMEFDRRAAPGSLLKSDQPTPRMKPKQNRQKSGNHLSYLRSLPCCCCGEDPAREAAHIRYADADLGKTEAGIGRKPDDRHAVPLCASCHRDGPNAQHTMGERLFWISRQLDPLLLAARLWAVTGDIRRGRQAVMDFYVNPFEGKR